MSSYPPHNFRANRASVALTALFLLLALASVDWLPVADTTFNFKATTNASYKNGKIVFHLSGVTKYEGWHMNDQHRGRVSHNGKREPHNGPDILFAPAGEQDTLNGKTRMGGEQ